MVYRRGINSLFLLATLFVLGLSSSRLSAEDTIHVVAKGETVYSISRLYRVNPNELIRYNNITNPDKLYVGRRLRIPPSRGVSSAAPPRTAVPAQPAPVSIPPASSSRTTVQSPGGNQAHALVTEYRVAEGDTLYSLARRYNVTLQVLRDFNDFSKNYVLKTGELIKIPGQAPVVVTQVPVPPPVAPAPTKPAAPQPPDPAKPQVQPPAPAKPQVQPPVSTRPQTPAQPATAPVQIKPNGTDGPLHWPVSASEVTYMKGKLTGVLLLAERSEPVRSITQGKVVAAGPHRGMGKVAIVETDNYLYVYGSCESLSVKEGDLIGPGTELGKLGIHTDTGKPQLVFLVYQNYSTPIDPAKAPRAPARFM